MFIGWSVKEESGQIVCGSSDLPTVSPGLTVRLQGLGGLPGEDMLLDTSSLIYHYRRHVKPHTAISPGTLFP